VKLSAHIIDLHAWTTNTIVTVHLHAYFIGEIETVCFTTSATEPATIANLIVLAQNRIKIT